MRRKLLIAGCLLALAGATTTAALLLSRGDDPGLTSTHPTSEQVLSAARADEITTLLASGDDVDVRKALALPPEQMLDAPFVQKLAALDLNVDEGTFKTIGPDEGTVDATTTTEGVTSVWTARLTKIDGTWFVASTAPKAGS